MIRGGPQKLGGKLLSRALRRAYYTVVLLALAFIVAENHTVFIAIVALGVVIDALRHRYASDLTLDEASVRRELSAALRSAQDVAGAKFRMNIIDIILIFNIAYTVACLLLSSSGSVAFIAYVERANFITDACADLFPSIHRHYHDLTAHGYPDRALIVSHVYSVQHVGFIIALLAHPFFVCWDRCKIELIRSEMSKNYVLGRNNLRKMCGYVKVTFSVLLCFGLYYFFEDILSIEYSGNMRHPFNMHVSNIPLVMSASIPFLFCIPWWKIYADLLLYEFDDIA